MTVGPVDRILRTWRKKIDGTMPTWRLKIYGRAPHTEHGRRKLHKGDHRVQGGIIQAIDEARRILKDLPDVDDLLDRVIIQRDRL